jgi:ABC-type uncharacterized transport system substrate-binding protein
LLSDLNQRRVEYSKPQQMADVPFKKWNVHVIKYLESPSSEQSESGVYLGLKESGLIEGSEYEIKARSAQGDIATLRMLIDAAITERADLIITLSTATLQTAIKRINDIPVVFTHVANPIVAGAGRSDEDHLPNITGAYNLSDYGGLIQIVRECIPGIRRVGTLFCPSEVNSVFHRDNLVEAGKNLGIDVITVGANTSSEVTDAAMSLCSRRIDAICQIADNLCDGSFITIAQAAQKTGTPLSGFSSHCTEEGAFIALARDFEDTGREAGLIAARVMRGEDPAAIPFETIRNSKLLVNFHSAELLKIKIPESVLNKASRVIHPKGNRE